MLCLRKDESTREIRQNHNATEPYPFARSSFPLRNVGQKLPRSSLLVAANAYSTLSSSVGASSLFKVPKRALEPLTSTLDKRSLIDPPIGASL
jgi:hypothetical protein